MYAVFTIIIALSTIALFIADSLPDPIISTGIKFAGSYFIISLIAGHIGWALYERQLKKNLVKERVSEMYGRRGIHYATMVIQFFVAAILAIVYITASIFLPILRGVEVITICLVGAIIGSVSGYLLERPHRDERVDFSDFL